MAAPGLRGIAKLRLLPNGIGVTDGAVLVAICHGVFDDWAQELMHCDLVSLESRQ